MYEQEDEHLEEAEEKEQDEQFEESQEEVDVRGEQQLWDHKDQGRNQEVKPETPVIQEELYQSRQQEEEEEEEEEKKQIAELKEVNGKKHDEQLEEEEEDEKVFSEGRNHEVKPEPPGVEEELKQVKQEKEEHDPQLKVVDSEKHHEQFEEDEEVLGQHQLWGHWHQWRNQEVKTEPPVMENETLHSEVKGGEGGEICVGWGEVASAVGGGGRNGASC